MLHSSIVVLDTLLQILACLRALSGSEITAAQSALTTVPTEPTFRFVIDGVEFSKDPQKIINEGKGLQIPVIVENVANEGEVELDDTINHGSFQEPSSSKVSLRILLSSNTNWA